LKSTQLIAAPTIAGTVTIGLFAATVRIVSIIVKLFSERCVIVTIGRIVTNDQVGAVVPVSLFVTIDFIATIGKVGLYAAIIGKVMIGDAEVTTVISPLVILNCHL